MLTRKKAREIQDTQKQQLLSVVEKFKKTSCEETENDSGGHLNPVEELKHLIQGGVNLNVKNEKGQTILHMLVQNYLEMSKNDFKKANKTQNQLCYDQFLEGIKLLLNSGFDANAIDDEGRNALHYIGYNLIRVCGTFFVPLTIKQLGIVELARVLVTGGADVLLKDKNELTPLHEVFCIGRVYGASEICDYLESVKDIPDLLRIELTELTGATEIIQDVFYYKKSYILKLGSALKRRQNLGLLSKRETSMNDVFFFKREARTVNGLTLSLECPEWAFGEAILIIARIMGPYHPGVENGLFHYLEHLDQHRYDGIRLPYEDDLAKKYHEITVRINGKASLQALNSATRMTLTMTRLIPRNLPAVVVSLEVLFHSIYLVQQNKDLELSFRDYEDSFDSAINAIYFLLDNDKAASAAIQKYCKLFNAFSIKKPCIFDLIIQGLGELSDALRIDTSLIAFEKLIKEISRVSEIEMSDSAILLYGILEFSSPDKLVMSHDGQLKELVDFLLKRGLHIHENGPDGDPSLIDILKRFGLDYSGLQYQTLQCLAAAKLAKSIREDTSRRMSFYDNSIIPEHLQRFVIKH